MPTSSQIRLRSSESSGYGNGKKQPYGPTLCYTLVFATDIWGRLSLQSQYNYRTNIKKGEHI